MTSTQFNILYELVGPQLSTQSNGFREGIRGDEAMYVALAVMGGDKRMWEASHDVQRGESTINKKLHAFCTVIVDSLLPTVVRFP